MLGVAFSAAPALAKKPKPPPCQGGSFVVTTPAEPLVPGSDLPPPDSLALGDAGSVSIASGCPEVAGKLRATRRGTKVSAKWTPKKGLCTGLSKRAKLKVQFDTTCETLTGTFKTKGTKHVITAQRGGLEVGAAQVEAFAEQLHRALARAADDVIAAVPPAAGVIAAAAEARGARLLPIAIEGASGGATGSGLRFPAPRPPRYELTLEFTDYLAFPGEVVLDGTLEYNFVVDDREDPPRQHGLVRGQLELAGPFAGTVDVHASIRLGVPDVTIVTAASGIHRVGEGDPPAFLSWVSTVAGGAGEGFADGPAGQALFSEPNGIAVDEGGHLYIADSGNGAIREIAPDGEVSTLAMGFERPYDLGIDADGDLVVSDRLSIQGPGDAPLVRVHLGGPLRGAVEAIVGSDERPCFSLQAAFCDGLAPIASLAYASGIDVGAITLVAQWAVPFSLRAVLPNGFVVTLARSTVGPFEETLSQPNDVAAGRSGEVYFTSETHTVRVRRPDGSFDTLAGTPNVAGGQDGPGAGALLSSPTGLVYDGLRTLYVAEWTGWRLRQVDSITGETWTVAACRPPWCNGPKLGLEDGPGETALFSSLEGLALDRAGDLWVVDGGNHAVRLVRIIADPDRAPEIVDFAPHTVQQGETARVVVRGRNLSTTSGAELAPGVLVDVEETGHREAVLTVSVAPDAEVGPRTLQLTTDYGTATAAAGLGFSVQANDRGGATVATLAGSGDLLAAAQDVLPGPLTAFILPTGLFAESGDRILVADPYAHSVRLVATRVGIVAEIVDLITSSALGADLNLLDAILGGLGDIGTALDTLGIRQAWTDNAEDAIRGIAEQAVDAVCAGQDCSWMSMPWAGVPLGAGETDGFRMQARLTFPADVYRANASTYYIADTGNDRLRIVGYDPSAQDEAVNQVFSLDRFQDFPFAVATGPPGRLVAYASLPEGPFLGRVDVEFEELMNQWAGDHEDPRCEQREGSPWPPIGIPLGMAGNDDALFVADPYCKTVWAVEEANAVGFVRNLRTDTPVEPAPKCSDGPVAFATFGAPVDVALEGDTVWVADAGCHSIRTIRARGIDPATTVALLEGLLESQAARLGEATAEAIRGKLDALDTDFLDQNRYWVTTVAGSTDGVAGFADGPAGEARFRYPTGIAVAPFGGGTRVFVADTGNRRLRMIEVP